MTAEKRAQPTPGTGRFEYDDDGLVAEWFADGSCSFDIFDAREWPGSDEDGMVYARLIADTAAERDRLKAANAELVGVLEIALPQAEGCWFNHYGDNSEGSPTPEYIKMMRATLQAHSPAKQEPTP